MTLFDKCIRREGYRNNTKLQKIFSTYWDHSVNDHNQTKTSEDTVHLSCFNRIKRNSQIQSLFEQLFIISITSLSEIC